MSVQLVIDMNLSLEWVTELARHGWSAVHWSAIGDPRAEDSVIMAWAQAIPRAAMNETFCLADRSRDQSIICGRGQYNGHVVLTHDLDFGALLALTHATGPSVLQVRGQDVLPEDIGPLVVAALRQHEAALAAGALVVVDLKKSRVRVLPF